MDENSHRECFSSTIDSNSKGFSLVELLFTLAILGILTAMLTQSYEMYKDKAQHSSALSLFTDTRTALEGGKIDSESFNGPMVVEESGPGVPGGDFGQILLKGLILPDKHKVYVRHTPNCAEDTCIEDIISVRHCHTHKIATLTQFKSGAVVRELHAEAEDPC